MLKISKKNQQREVNPKKPALCLRVNPAGSVNLSKQSNLRGSIILIALTVYHGGYIQNQRLIIALASIRHMRFTQHEMNNLCATGTRLWLF